MNPISTGCERKKAIHPSLRTPMRSLAPATTRARSAARATNSGEPADARGRRAPSVRREVRATGPVCSQGEEAKNAAAMGATAPTYRPR